MATVGSGFGGIRVWLRWWAIIGESSGREGVSGGRHVGHGHPGSSLVVGGHGLARVRWPAWIGGIGRSVRGGREGVDRWGRMAVRHGSEIGRVNVTLARLRGACDRDRPLALQQSLHLFCFHLAQPVEDSLFVQIYCKLLHVEV